MLKSVLFVLLFMVLIGCGDSDGKSHKEDVSLRTLYFVDSPVNGISYSCGIRKGVTKTDSDSGRHGAFYCKDEAVTFKLGTLTIGTIAQFVNGDEIHPQNFVAETPHDYFENEEVLKLAMLLQSLDDDGRIDEYINITPETVAKLQIGSLKELTMKQVKEEIIRIGKKPREFNAMKEHLIKHSHIPEITNPTIIYVTDDKKVGSFLEEKIEIKSAKYISKIDIISGEGSDHFYINKNGAIQLKKSLDFKKKNRYVFEIVAVTPLGSSKNAQLVINVESSIEGEENFIHKATVSDTTIYTKDSHYDITIYGQERTNIYINNEFIGVMPQKRSITLTLDSPTKEGENPYSIVLKYENGIDSDPTSYTVVKDTIAPVITTPSSISVDENMEIIENIDVEESNNYGLRYSLLGEDSHHFNISSNGKLTFSTSISFENPTDSNRDNKYEIMVIVTDIAGNSSLSKKFTISVGDILNSPPVIGDFDEQINTSLTVGSIIGRVDINEGNSSITSLYLDGEGKEYFDIHDNGDIILLQRLMTQRTFNLEIVATNEFDTTRQAITIEVNAINDINAKAQIDGGLSNATVKLIKLHSNNYQELISTSTTKSTGDFNLKTSLLDDNSLYIYEISGGVDINTHQPNQGVLRMIAKGSWLKDASSKVMVTPLSEMLYSYVAKYVKNDYVQLDKKLDEVAKILLEKDLTGNYIIDAKDILVFNPSYHQGDLYPTLKYNSSYQTITDKIKTNSSDYIKALFNAKVTKSFVDVENTKTSGIASYVGEIKFSGTIAYYHQGDTFYTYDMYNKKVLGTLKLEEQDLSAIDPISLLSSEANDFDVKIYLDLNQNRVYVENLNQKIFIIDITNSRTPKLLTSFQTPLWSTYIELSINNQLYLKSTSALYNIFNVYDTNNPNNIRQLNDVRINMFTHVTNYKAYDVSTDKCSETNQLTITTYNLQDILTNSSNKKIYYLPTYNCYGDEVYFDDNYMYVYAYNTFLKVYSLPNYSSEPTLISTFPYHVSKILNQDSNNLYVYADNYIYFIDTTDIYNLKIRKKILYRYKYNSTKYFTDTDNLKITIQNNFIVESSRLIDLESHVLSSIYTETENGIDMSLFERY